MSWCILKLSHDGGTNACEMAMGNREPIGKWLCVISNGSLPEISNKWLKFFNTSEHACHILSLLGCKKSVCSSPGKSVLHANTKIPASVPETSSAVDDHPQKK